MNQDHGRIHTRLAAAWRVTPSDLGLNHLSDTVDEAILAKKRSKRQAAEEPSFEQALEQLGEIVHQLEEGEIGLDGALEQYEKGVRLLGQCYRLLEKAQRRIELLSGVDADGRPVLTPMDEPTPSLAEKAAGHGRPTQGLSGPPERGGPAAEGNDIDVSGQGT